VELVAVKLREHGLHVSTSQIVDAAIVATTYASLRGIDICRFIASDELAFVLSSTFARLPGDEDLVRQAITEVLQGRQGAVHDILKGIEYDLRRLSLSFGAKIRRPARLLHDREKAQAYARLKLLGLIHRTKRGERVVSRDEAYRIARRLASTYGSYQEALESLVVRDLERGGLKAVQLGTELVSMKLDRASVDALIALAKGLLKHGERSVAFEFARRAALRIAHGERVRDVFSAYELLSMFDLIDSSTALALIRMEPELAPQLINLVDPYLLISKLAHHERERVLAQLAKSPKHSRLVAEMLVSGKLKPTDLRLTHGGSELTLRLASEAAHVLEYIVRAITAKNPAYVDLAVHTLNKLEAKVAKLNMVDVLTPELKRLRTLIRAIEEEDYRSALRLLLRYMELPRALELLYKVARSPDPRIRRAAQRLLAVVSSRLRHLGRAGGSERAWSRRGRLDLRKAMRLRFFISSAYDIAVTRRSKEKVVLVVDKSGSMKPYAAACIIAAASFAENLSRIVLFDSQVYVLKGGKLSLDRLLDILFNVEFEGYTNVTAALLEAVKGHPPSKLVLISDLRQTVASSIPPRAVIERIVRSGWRIYVLSPPTVDRKVLEGLRGIRLSVFESEDELIRALRRLIA
jgi:hypothetical protein